MASRSKKLHKSQSSRICRRRLGQSQRRELDFQTLEPRNLLATVVVSTANDFVSPTADTTSIAGLIANDGGDGISLREAIEAANNTTGGDTVTFDGSVFTGGDNSVIRLTQGELEISEELTIDGSSGTELVLTGDAADNDVTVVGNLTGGNITDAAASLAADENLLSDNTRVLYFSSTNGDLALSDLNVTGGWSFNSFSRSGGGIRFNSVDELTLTNSIVSGNAATGGLGGGIISRDGDVSLINSAVSENISGGRGGGIFTDSGDVSLVDSAVDGNINGGGISTRFGSVTLVNSTVNNNNSRSSGGGIVVVTGAYREDVTLIDSQVKDNTSSRHGGGIYTRNANVVLTRSTVSGNASAGDGGGIRTEEGSTTLLDSTVRGNISGRDGGGIFTAFNTVTLTNSTVSGNTSERHGGGVRTDFGDITATNSTVSGNDSGGNGGGLYTYSGYVTLTNSTISDNSATSGRGGGIGFFSGGAPLLEPSLVLRNSIVADNTDDGTAPDSLALVEPDSELIVENSLIGDTTGSGITAATGSGNILNQSARLAALADNGGLTKTHRLLRGSPAINSGSDVLAAELLTDQRGDDRINFGTVDIGAYELQSLVIGPRAISTVRDQGGVLVRPDLLNTFVVTFDQDVNVGAGDLVIMNDTLGSIFEMSSVVFSYDVSTWKATWDFSSAVLGPSFYTFELSDTITGVRGGLALDGDGDGTAGGNFAEEVYVAIPGDANLDGDVEVNEINIFLGTNTGDGATVLSNLDRAGAFTWSQGDFNGDGDVDANQLNIFTGEQSGDYAVFLANLGRNVRPGAPQPVTSQPSTIQPVTSRPEFAETVSAVPVTVPVSAAVQLSPRVADPFEVTAVTAQATSVEQASFGAEVLTKFAPASESALFDALINFDVLDDSHRQLVSSAEANASLVVAVDSSLELEGAHKLLDGFFSEDIRDDQNNAASDVNEGPVDVLTDAWDWPSFT